jgi:cell division protein ZapE
MPGANNNYVKISHSSIVAFIWELEQKDVTLLVDGCSFLVIRYSFLNWNFNELRRTTNESRPRLVKHATLFFVSLIWLSDVAATTNTLPDFLPPPRFGKTQFETYQPQHPSQELALEKTRAFIHSAQHQPALWFWQKKALGQGLYLDGGFGVGKTHLLAAAFEAFETSSKVYLSFAELVYVIGVLGKVKALEQLGHYRLYCIDEFELDDPGNTLIVKTFLSHVFGQGAHVITTSNTPPAAQGQGRFNAHDFKREIQSIAQRFEVVTIEGPDYRQRDNAAKLFEPNTLETLMLQETFDKKVRTTWTQLFIFLQAHHPVHYSAFLKQMHVLYIEQVSTIVDQNDALRFVHFIDKLYDLKISLRISGEIPLAELFHSNYRNSAYGKKHNRCLSRIAELLDEVTPKSAIIGI